MSGCFCLESWLSPPPVQNRGQQELVLSDVAVVRDPAAVAALPETAVDAALLPPILIDSGNPGQRDPQRIAKVVTRIAGLRKIDHLIVTHYHGDHYGGAATLAKLVPIGTIHDNGVFDGMGLHLSTSTQKIARPVVFVKYLSWRASRA